MDIGGSPGPALSSPSQRIAASLGVTPGGPDGGWQPALETPLTARPDPDQVDSVGKLHWKHMNTVERAVLLPSETVETPPSLR